MGNLPVTPTAAGSATATAYFSFIDSFNQVLQ